MRLVPIRYTADVDRTVAFYRALGLDTGPRSRPNAWAELPAAGGTLAVHRADGPAHWELAFEADEPLEDVTARLRAAGFDPGPVVDESHGRAFRITDPDGVPVQVNEFDRELYT